ncbi:tetratricopeptide repeat protein, partial [Helicobacter felis]|uniref:tetratricopeptide repeat protein n=1 Tax=Helicobacter felis TaxID=214 RepID=UPI0018F856E9
GPQDYQQALKYYQKAGEMGDGGSYRILGDMYYNGQGVRRDYVRVVSYYQKAGEMGDTKAYNILGDMYKNGQGVPQNYPKAFDYYQKAGEMGDGGSYRILGDMYYNGQGMQKNYQGAVAYYQKAGEMGNPYGYVLLADMYYGGHGVEQDYAKAFDYYQKAGSWGHGVAFYHLGNLYQNGQGVQKSPVLALKYFQKACDVGFKKACAIEGVKDSSVQQESKQALQAKADRERVIVVSKKTDALATKIEDIGKEIDALTEKIEDVAKKMDAYATQKDQETKAGNSSEQTIKQSDTTQLSTPSGKDTSLPAEAKEAKEQPEPQATQKHEIVIQPVNIDRNQSEATQPVATPAKLELPRAGAVDTTQPQLETPPTPVPAKKTAETPAQPQAHTPVLKLRPMSNTLQ